MDITDNGLVTIQFNQPMKFNNSLKDKMNDKRKLQAADEPKPFSVRYIKGYDKDSDPDDFAANDMVGWEIVDATGDGRF